MAMEALQDLQDILSKCLVLLDFEASQMSDIVGEWNLKDNCSVKFGQQVFNCLRHWSRSTRILYYNNYIMYMWFLVLISST